MRVLLSFLSILLLNALSAYGSSGMPKECQPWFEKAKIARDRLCVERCVALKIDMDTFDCRNSCDDLCSRPLSEQLLFELSDLYPGLTPAEKELAAKHPKDTLLAYRLSWRAEKLCLEEFPRSETNDGSDACRHFVWAVLLERNFGAEMAQKILDAHEQEPTQPAEEKAMDMANNQRGVSFGSTVTKGKDIPDLQILSEFRRLMRDEKLVVLKKRK